MVARWMRVLASWWWWWSGVEWRWVGLGLSEEIYVCARTCVSRLMCIYLCSMRYRRAHTCVYVCTRLVWHAKGYSHMLKIYICCII